MLYNSLSIFVYFYSFLLWFHSFFLCVGKLMWFSCFKILRNLGYKIDTLSSELHYTSFFQFWLFWSFLFLFQSWTFPYGNLNLAYEFQFGKFCFSTFNKFLYMICFDQTIFRMLSSAGSNFDCLLCLSP